MRLKLAGGDRSKRSRLFVRWRAQTHARAVVATNRMEELMWVIQIRAA